MPDSQESGLTHVVTLRDIYEQGQATHTEVVGLKHEVRNTRNEVREVKKKQDEQGEEIESIKLDRAKLYGMAAAVSFFISIIGTSGVVLIVQK